MRNNPYEGFLKIYDRTGFGPDLLFVGS